MINPKKKKCIVCQQDHYIFSKKMCKPCWQKQYSKSIKKVSTSHQQTLNEYKPLRLDYLSLHPICELCNKAKSTDIHHICGKIGELYLDTRYWLGICRQCHSTIHDSMSSKDAIVMCLKIKTKC